MKFLTRPNLLYIIVACAMGVGLIVLDSIWLQNLSPELTGKLMVTLGTIAALAAVVYVIAANIEDDTKMKKNKFLD